MAADHATVLLVEDEIPIVELVTFTLKDAGCRVTAVDTVQSAWDSIRHSRPNLVLLDWMLPDQSGLRLLSRLRAEREYRDLPVIMLTAKSMEEDKIAGLDSGADDYITKPFSPRELAARVNAMLRRNAPEKAAGVIRVGPVTLDPLSVAVRLNEEKLEIGHSEFKLLKFLMSHPERVYSRGQLIDKVWGDQVLIEERTVDVHILRLRKVLGNAGYLIKTVRSVGYKLSEETSSV
ncbi:response regulator [Noviherbaspirillum sp. ST9]|uniref:response regulator n=1 Tax=Noviherbaspirillum sp. ST9 TaxID=3401606 RepID=UPI003B58AAA9